MEINQILINREEKFNFIKQYLKDNIVITLKANIPGLYKQSKEAYILINYFDRILANKGIIKSFELDGADGPMYVYLLKDCLINKADLIEIEENYSLGRYIDIDIFNKTTISLNRKELRKCFICDKPAFVCARNKSHKIEELIQCLEIDVTNELKSLIYDLCNESILAELNLHPKFGLVTPYSNGSHPDMNYEIMVTGKNAILDSFTKMFLVGYNSNNLEEIFTEIRKIGKLAEENMLKVNSGINTYKGLIFDLGLIVTAVGYKLGNKKEESIFNIIKILMKEIHKEPDDGIETFGKKAYIEYKIGGAKEEAINGFPNVIKIINKYNLDSENEYYKALIDLIISVEDTNLLKRSGSIENYLEVKERFKTLRLDEIDHFSEKCIKLNLSFGGSADLLIVSIFLKKLNNILTINL